MYRKLKKIKEWVINHHGIRLVSGFHQALRFASLRLRFCATENTFCTKKRTEASTGASTGAGTGAGTGEHEVGRSSPN